MQSFGELKEIIAAWPDQQFHASHVKKFLADTNVSDAFRQLVEERLTFVLDHDDAVRNRIEETGVYAERIHVYTLMDAVKTLRENFPETLYALPPELTSRLLAYLYLNSGEFFSHPHRETLYFYGFFHRGTTGPQALQGACKAHCESMQQMLANLHADAKDRKSSPHIPRPYASVVSFFSDFPDALVKIGPNFLAKNLAKAEGDFLNFDHKARGYLYSIVESARIIAAQGENGVDERLEHFFRPFGLAAHIVTSRHSTHPEDCVVVAVPEKGLFVSYQGKFTIVPFASALEDMMHAPKYGRIYHTKIIPRLIQFIHDLREKIPPGIAEDDVWLKDAEYALANTMRRTNDLALQKAYRRFYPADPF